MYVSCAIISTVQSTSANQIDVPASSEDKSKARQSLAPAGVFLFNSFFNYSLWSLFCQWGNSKKQLVKITVIFAPELCKMVRHKLISCNFELRITYTLLQNYTAARCFCMGATLWRNFLLLGLRDYSALLGEDYERCIWWVNALPFFDVSGSAARWRSCIIIERGKLVHDDVYNSFEDNALRFLNIKVKKVLKMSNPALFVRNMND